MAVPQPLPDSNHRSSWNGPPRKLVRGSIILFVLLILIFSGIPRTLYNEFVYYQHKKIKTYLDEIKAYTLFKNDEINPVLENWPNLSINEITDLQLKHIELKYTVLQLKPLRVFSTHHELIIENIDIMDEYLAEYSKSLQTGDPSLVHAIAEQLNFNSQRIRDETIRVLTEKEIPITFFEDGSFEYEIKVRNEVERKRMEAE